VLKEVLGTFGTQSRRGEMLSLEKKKGRREQNVAGGKGLREVGKEGWK